MGKNVENQNVSSGFKRLISLTLVIALFTPAITYAQTGKVNFSGTWILNTAKRTPVEGQGQRMGGGNFTATQDANNLTVERSRTNQNGENIVMTMKYTLDGKESVNTSPRGNSKSVASWSADGKTLTIVTTRTFERDGATREMKSTDIWSLTDAKTITVQSAFTTPDGERKSTFVYDKK